MMNRDGSECPITPWSSDFESRAGPDPKDAGSDRLLQESRQLAIEQAAIVGAAGSVRPLERGEDPETGELADADHWVATYTELVDFSRQLLSEVAPTSLDPEGPPGESVSPTRLALELQLQLHLLHLRYWRRRRDQLGQRSAGRGSSEERWPARSHPNAGR